MGYQKNKRKKQRDFVALLRPLLRSPEWLLLSKSAMLAYVYIKTGYNGANNGEIVAPYGLLQKVLRSSATVCKVLEELETKHWIEKTVQGGLFKRASKYRLTFLYDKFQ